LITIAEPLASNNYNIVVKQVANLICENVFANVPNPNNLQILSTRYTDCNMYKLLVQQCTQDGNTFDRLIFLKSEIERYTDAQIVRMINSVYNAEVISVLRKDNEYTVVHVKHIAN
jgi:hypothetical protein